jgi:hypothetical protein
MGDIQPVLNVAGTSTELPLRVANDVMNAICSVNFPWKWNDILMPQFCTNSYQQDYAGIYPNGTSVTNLSWLERGIVIDINNTAQPKPYRIVEVGRQLPQATGTIFNSATNNPLFLTNWFPNSSLYYGTWGGGQVGSPSFGNNPYPGAVYNNPIGVTVQAAFWTNTAGGQITFQLNYIPNNAIVGNSLYVTNVFPTTYNNSYPIVSINTNINQVTVTATTNPGLYEIGGIVNCVGYPPYTSGGTIQTDENIDRLQWPNLNQPRNPITQIEDANGNLLVLTQYGTEGTTAPLAPPNSAPGTTCFGTGATTIWTVVDPNGMGFRIDPVPTQTGVVWQFNLWGQALPIKFTKLSQTLFPLPDQYEPNFRQMFIAQMYRYSSEAKIRAKFKDEWALGIQALNECRTKSDRELEENVFIPERGIMGGNRGRSHFAGAAWPWNYPLN